MPCPSASDACRKHTLEGDDVVPRLAGHASLDAARQKSLSNFHPARSCYFGSEILHGRHVNRLGSRDLWNRSDEQTSQCMPIL